MSARVSFDMEDIIAVLDGRPGIDDEVRRREALLGRVAAIIRSPS